MSKKRDKDTNKEDFKSFFDILPEEIKSKIIKKIKEKEILNYLSSILEGNFKNHIKPIYIKNDVIHIVVDNPIWGQEFLFYKEHFLKRINFKYNENFKDISYKFSPKYFLTISKIDSFEKLDKELQENIENELSEINDSDLKNRLKNLMASIFLSNKQNNK
jgi:hypothetical protein